MKQIRATLSPNDEFNLRQQMKAFNALSDEQVLNLLLKTMVQIMCFDNQIKQLIKKEIK